jgi:hypothetical protein
VLSWLRMADDSKSSTAITVAVISAVAAIAVALIGIYSPKKSDSPPQTIPATVSQQAQPSPSKTLPQQQPPASTAEISPTPKVSAHLPATSTPPVMKHEVLNSAPKPTKPLTQPSPQIDSRFWANHWNHAPHRHIAGSQDYASERFYNLAFTRLDNSHGTGHLSINLWAPEAKGGGISCVAEYSLTINSTSDRQTVSFRADRTKREGTGSHCSDVYQPRAVVGTITLTDFSLDVDAGSTDLSQSFQKVLLFQDSKSTPK